MATYTQKSIHTSSHFKSYPSMSASTLANVLVQPFFFNLVPYGVFIGCQDMDVCKKFASTACMVSWVRETCKSKCSACGYGKFLQETLKNE